MNIRARAATPATVFLLAAFVLLLLSVISVPITKSIALGSFNGVSFGVFGYCVNGKCSKVQLGYNPDQAIAQASTSSKRSLQIRQDPGNPNFSLPPSARNGLSNILIVHVIATALTLIALILSIVAHVRRPSHSVRFLLAIFIISILNTILTLLSFLVDLLVFVPHFAFGTWLVLAATICNSIATILLCCGRRTLIGRKAMRRRIAENSEMSGQNYFKEEAAKEMALRNSENSKVPQYAEFEVNKPASPDRLPLNPSQTHLMAAQDRNGSDRSGETMSTEDTLSGGYRGGLPSGPSPYGGGGYPPAVRMPRPYGAIPPVRTPADRRYPPPPGPIPPSRSNASLNSMNRAPRSGYETAPPLPPAAVGVDRHASSVYSEYVPARRNWGPAPVVAQGVDDNYADNRYRPERPRVDTYNLDRDDRMVDNPYGATRRSPDIDAPPVVLDRGANRNRRTSDSGTMIASYYEDVDPRYDDTPEEEIDAPNVYTAPLQQSRRPIHRSDVGEEPVSTSPIRRNFSSNSLDGPSRGAAPVNNDEEYRSGPRSPAASTSSHFTSVSQRGINPRWQPQPPPQFIGVGGGGGGGGGGDTMMYPRRNRPRNDQMNFLTGNPDFELPVRSGKRNASNTMPVPPLDGGGRYPLPR